MGIGFSSQEKSLYGWDLSHHSLFLRIHYTWVSQGLCCIPMCTALWEQAVSGWKRQTTVSPLPRAKSKGTSCWCLCTGTCMKINCSVSVSQAAAVVQLQLVFYWGECGKLTLWVRRTIACISATTHKIDRDIADLRRVIHFSELLGVFTLSLSWAKSFLGPGQGQCSQLWAIEVHRYHFLTPDAECRTVSISWY